MAFENLKIFVVNTFPAIQNHITEDQYEQIAWIDENYQTNAPISAPSTSVNINFSQQRIFARLYFLMLLRFGTEDAYQAFIAVQPEPRLSKENFQITAQFIQNLSAKEYEQLWVATTVSMSVHANQRATTILDNGKPPRDSVEFLALIMSQHAYIYPAALELIEKDDSASEGFETMFNTGHFRHMLHIEDGTKMYNKLKVKIQAGQVDAEKLNLWFSYWLIAVVGFAGYTKEHGSQFFNDHTFKAVHTLKKHLDEYLSSNASYPIYQNYLHERGSWIHLGNTFLNTAFFAPADNLKGIPLAILSRMAGMLHLVSLSKWQSASLKLGIARLKAKLPHEVYAQLLFTLDSITNSDEPAITYAPAFFEKLKQAVGFVDTIYYGLLIYAEAIIKYRRLREAGAIDLSTPLNLNDLASKDSIKNIADTIRHKEAFDVFVSSQTSSANFLVSPTLAGKLAIEAFDKKIAEDFAESEKARMKSLAEGKFYYNVPANSNTQDTEMKVNSEIAEVWQILLNANLLSDTIKNYFQKLKDPSKLITAIQHVNKIQTMNKVNYYENLLLAPDPEFFGEAVLNLEQKHRDKLNGVLAKFPSFYRVLASRANPQQVVNNADSYFAVLNYLINSSITNREDYLDSCINHSDIFSLLMVIKKLDNQNLFGINIENSEHNLSILLAATHPASLLAPLKKFPQLSQDQYLKLIADYGDRKPVNNLKQTFPRVFAPTGSVRNNEDSENQDPWYDRSSSSNEFKRP